MVILYIYIYTPLEGIEFSLGSKSVDSDEEGTMYGIVEGISSEESENNS